MKKPRAYMVANAHLDTVWNWTLEDTVYKFLKATLEQNFALFEKYPNYNFNFEGAYRYALIREYYPEQYERLKAYVAEGRWFVAGSSWENGDVITPAPETLIRNILYGNRFFEREFGKKCNDIFLPDCFGFPCTLPAVMRHMGLTAFSSQKLTWNEGRKPPFHVGIWQGIDGSEVIAALDPGAYTTVLNEMPSRDRALAERTAALPAGKDLRYYGTGDRGGSPTEASACFVSRAVTDAEGDCEIVSAYAGQLADELTQEERAMLPRTDEELLMTTHGVGSYTSVSPAKRFHRSNELKADFAERSAVFASWLGARDYPAKTLTKAWCDFIRHEFHDDLTGTSVQRAYRETFHDDIVVNNTLDGEIGASLSAIAANVDTGDEAGIKLTVFNPTAYARRDVAEADIDLMDAQYIRVLDPAGREVPSQILGNNNEKKRIAFLADVPSQGYAVYRLLPAELPFRNASLGIWADTLENERLRVRLDKNGDIASVYDKENQRELLRAPIRFEILKNSFRGYGAWEIGYDDLTAPPEQIVGGPVKTRVVQNGGCRVALEVVRVCGTSRFTQTLSLDAGGDRLNVYNDVNWTQSCSLLKAAFPLELDSPTARYDAGLGSVERQDRTPEKYEVPVHKWANVFDRDGNYSVTILNDCKYGMDKNGNVLRLTCIHTPANRFMEETRQDLQDFGQNVFSFAVGGGRGDFRETRAQRAGTLFHNPLTVCVSDSHGGILPKVYSFFSVDNDAIAVCAVKKAEDSDETIVRICESAGRPAVGSFTFGPGVASARETDGYEQPVGAAKTENGRVCFSLSPFMMKTFAVRLNRPPEPAETRAFSKLPLPAGLPFTSSNADRGKWGVGAKRTTVPRETIQKDFTAAGVPFSYCEKNPDFVCVVPNGEQIELPAGTGTLHLVAARADKDGAYTVLADGKPLRFSVQCFDDDIGGWDQYGSGHYGFIREDRVAFCASHTHDVDGDRVYGRFCWYLYDVRLPENTRRIVLPADEHMMIAAITAERGVCRARLATDIALHKNKKTPRRLFVDGKERAAYRPGDPVFLTFPGNPGSVVWSASDGTEYTGMSAAFDMPDHDLSVTTSASPYFRKVAVSCVLANTDPDAACPVSHLTDGCRHTLFRAAVDGEARILLDLGSKRRFSHLVLYHAGAAGADPTLNTSAYAVDAFVAGEWECLARADHNILPVTQHDFCETCSRFVRIRIETPTRSGNDRRASLAGVALYADADYGDETEQDPVTAYDRTDEPENDEILFDGECRSDTTVTFPQTVLVTGWRIDGARSASVALTNGSETALSDSGRDVKEENVVGRLIPRTQAKRFTVTALDPAVRARLRVYGKSIASVPLKKYRASECGGSRNPAAVKHPDGSVTLAAADGSGHDLYGYQAVLPAGKIAFSMRVRIDAHELASLPDHTELFAFNPVFPDGEAFGRKLTVGDYKNAPADGRGYRTLKDAFTSRLPGGCEGRIVSFRRVNMDVFDFVFYAE